MSISQDLLKITIVNRKIMRILDKDPNAYADIGGEITGWHNYRAELIVSLENRTGGIVKFVNNKAELLDRNKYLADHTRLYDLYTSDKFVEEKDIPRLNIPVEN